MDSIPPHSHDSDHHHHQIIDVLTQCRDYSETIYQLKWLPWRGEFAPIVTQNANGPCPLLALCNVLLLRGKMFISPGTIAISSHELLNNLATIMFEMMPQVVCTSHWLPVNCDAMLGIIGRRCTQLSTEYS